MTVHWTPGVFPFKEGREYEVDPETGCWVWQFTLTSKAQYPCCQRRRFTEATGTPYAHRQGYIALHGPLPPEIHVHHRCHNKLCVNPAHLEASRAGDHQSHHRMLASDLTVADVIAIREAAWNGARIKDLAGQWGLAASHIGFICDGTKWPKVGGPIGRPPKLCEVCGGPITSRLSRKAKYCSKPCYREGQIRLKRRKYALTATSESEES